VVFSFGGGGEAGLRVGKLGWAGYSSTVVCFTAADGTITVGTLSVDLG
jgi:hypothetical protein